jgi:hypothetical protein
MSRSVVLAVFVAAMSFSSIVLAQQPVVTPSEPALVSMKARLDSASKKRPFDYQGYKALGDSLRPALWRLIESDRLRTADDFLAASSLAFDPIGFYENRRVEHEMALAAFVLGHPGAVRRLAFTWDGLNLSIGRGQRLGSYAAPGGTPDNMDPVPAPEVVRAFFKDPQGALARTAARAVDPELQRLRDEDQADREGAIDEAKMARMRERDPQRRARVLELVAAGRPAMGRDFHNAATVLQHGGSVDAFRLAHELSIVAFALGDTAARWLVSRTYDRMLLHLGHRQRLATQFFGDDRLWPIDTTAMNDRVRRLLGGRALAEARAMRPR